MNKNGNLTEREQALINHILFLISILNIYTMTIGYIYKKAQSDDVLADKILQESSWLEYMLKNHKTNEAQEKLIQNLIDEFGIKLELAIDRDIINGQ